MFDIQAEHPEYRKLKQAWPRYRDLYAGGDQFVRNAGNYLTQRQTEPARVYQERLERVFYENYIGSIIDWYAATLFRREPLLSYEGDDPGARAFFNMFAEDCDRRGSTLSDFYRRQVIEALVAGKSYIVADFPRVNDRAPNRAMEDALGISRAYLCSYPVESAVNWERDENGELEWIVLRTERQAGEWQTERRWIRYDRERFEILSQFEVKGKASGVVAIDSGPHGFAAQRRVPVFEFSLGEGMWLMNKAASLQLEHFNKSNALAWALTMGLFAMPVVYSEREHKQVVGESYYLQLGPNDRFGWTEPEGHVFEIALQNIDRLKEEIYRVCYLLSMAGGSLSKNSALTGLSKQRDYVITQEVLRGFGDKVKDSMNQVLRAIAEARQDALEARASGLDEFDIGDFSDELDDARKLLELGIESPTLKAEVFKKLAMKFLCDSPQDLKDRIAQEIDAKN
jgi:hypothetical protein